MVVTEAGGGELLPNRFGLAGYIELQRLTVILFVHYSNPEMYASKWSG